MWRTRVSVPKWLEVALLVGEVQVENGLQLGDRGAGRVEVGLRWVSGEGLHRSLGTDQRCTHPVVFAVQFFDELRVDAQLGECRPEDCFLIVVVVVELECEVAPGPAELGGSALVAGTENGKRSVETLHVSSESRMDDGVHGQVLRHG